MKFDTIANEMLRDETLQEGNLDKAKKIAKALAKKFEKAMTAAAKKLDSEMTDEDALEVWKNFSKDIDKDDLY
jgi:hypothetical protein